MLVWLAVGAALKAAWDDHAGHKSTQLVSVALQL